MSYLTPEILIHYWTVPWDDWEVLFDVPLIVEHEAVELEGAKTDKHPITVSSQSKTGALISSWGTELWGQVIVFPVKIDYKFLQADRDDNVILWNTFLYDVQECTDISPPPMGIELVHDILPFPINPLEEYVVQINAFVVGPIEIKDYIYFTFTAAMANLYLSGIRTLVFTHMPNAGWKERLEWNTDIILSYRGEEDRISVRQDPAQYYSGSFFLNNAHKNTHFESLVTGGHMRVFVLPVWPESIKYVGTILNGATELIFDNAYASYREGGYIIFIHDYRTAEVMEIAEVHSGRIVFARPLTQDHINPTIAPARTARLWVNPSMTDFFFTKSSASLEFRVIDSEAITGSPSIRQYRGRDVFEGQYLLNGARKREVMREYDVVDFKVGKVDYLYGAEWSTSVINNVSLYRNTRETAWALRNWLHRRAGMLLPFWIKTYRKEIELLTTFGVDTITHQIKNINYTGLLFSNPMYRNICFEKEDGTEIFRRVLGATYQDEDTELITLDESFGFVGTPASFKRICFLSLVRLSTDSVDVYWRNVGRAIASFGLVGVSDDEN